LSACLGLAAEWVSRRQHVQELLLKYVGPLPCLQAVALLLVQMALSLDLRVLEFWSESAQARNCREQDSAIDFRFEI